MRASDHLLLRGYGPLLGFALLLTLMALLVPTVDADEAAVGGQGMPTGADGQAGTSNGGGGQAPAGGDDAGGPRIEGGGSSSSAGDGATSPDGDGAASGEGGGASDGAGGESGSAAEAASEGVRACEDRDWQIEGDPYSPPCVTFEGDNGGATHRGVTADEIQVTARVPEGSGGQAALAEAAGATISDTREDRIRTARALVEYINDRFEFYGREVTIEFYAGEGDPDAEAMGGGYEGAQADALHVAEDVGAFAELRAGSAPFGDALAGQGVIALGAPHLPATWMEERRPYSWSIATDCSVISAAGSEFGIKRLAGRTAAYAGPEFRDQERRSAVVVPENPVYRHCVERMNDGYEAAGLEPPDVLTYTLNMDRLSNQAANLVAQLQDAGYTTVTCSCDPVLPVYLTSRAEEQGYEPEWIVSGAALMDQDVVGQLMQQDQWSRAFGISYAGQAQPQQATLGYNAYKQVHDDEPASGVNLWYYNLYLLAIGIQGAGPELTPETFEQGMFDYPGGQGPAGTWGFGPGNYSSTEDYREIYWDPEAVSVYNGETGAYIEADPGVRYRPGELPEGPPRIPQ